MICVHVFILCPDHRWKISLNCFYKKKSGNQCQESLKSTNSNNRNNQSVQTSLEHKYCSLFHLHWSTMFILYMGYQYLLNFFLQYSKFHENMSDMSKLNVISLKKNDGIGSLFERSDAFQCCMFSSTLGSLVILVHLVKNLILWQ